MRNELKLNWSHIKEKNLLNLAHPYEARGAYYN